MDHDTLEKLKQTHTSLKLLNADNMPLIIGFLYKVFIQPNKRDMPMSDVLSRLEDYLYHPREIHGDEKYPRPDLKKRLKKRKGIRVFDNFKSYGDK